MEPKYNQKLLIGGNYKFEDIPHKKSLKYFYTDNLNFKNEMTFYDFNENYLKEAV